MRKLIILSLVLTFFVGFAAAQGPYEVTINAVDTDGNSIEANSICMVSEGFSGCEEDGSSATLIVPEGFHDIKIDASGYRSLDDRDYISRDQTKTYQLKKTDDVEEPDSYEVTINTVNNNGNSVEADKICMSSEEFSNCQRDESEATFIAPEDYHDIEIEKTGYRDISDRDYISRDQTKTYQLKKRDDGKDANIDLRSPENGESDVSRRPRFSWKIEGAGSADDVELFVEEKEFGSDKPWNQGERYDVSDVTESERSFRVSSNLDYDTDYVWGVEADIDGDEVRSDVFDFTTENDEEDEEGSLEVTVRDEGHDRLENAYVRVRNGDYESERTDNDGEASFDNLESGDYEVRVRCEGEVENRDIYIGEGEHRELDVEMDFESSDNECNDETDLEAYFSVSDSSPDTDQLVDFDASGSEGDINEYRWSFPDGSTRYGRTVSESFDSPGDKEVTLKVTGDGGDTDTYQRTLDVGDVSDREGELEVTVRDEDYDRLENARVRVRNGDYETERTDNDGEASFNNLESGDYEVRVRCEDETEYRDIYVSEGETEYLNVEMNLESSDNECDDEDGEALDAFFTVSDSSPDTGESVRFDASGSDGDIKEYRWSFPDETRYGRTVSESFDSEGSLDVRLRVTDTDGNRDSYERTINVRDVSDDVTAVIDASDTNPRVGESVSFDGSGSLGDIKEYRWRFDDGTTRYGTSTVKRFDNEGAEQVQLTVTGDNGDRDTDSVTINVGERERCGVDIEEIEFNDYDESDDEVEASLEISNDGDSQDLEVEFFVDNEQVESFDTEIGSGNRRFSTDFPDDEGTDVRAEIRTTGDPCGDGFYERSSTYREDDFDGGDERPEAKLDIDPNQADIGEEIDFDARDSMDPDGEIEEYEFDLDGDGDYEISNDDGEVERSFYYEVDTRAEVKVTDNDGYTDTASERYRVEAENRVSFSNVNIPGDVCAGDNFEVTFDARNIGDDERVLIVEGEGFGDRNSYSTHLEEDEEEEITITFTTDDPGTEEFTIRALGGNSDSIENSIEVLDCEEDSTAADASGISLDLEPTRIRAGEPVKASGYVENTRGRQNVRIEINNRREQEVSTEPDGYYSTTIYPERTGNLDISAETGEQRVSRSLTVLPTVSVGSMDVPDTVFQGDEIEICAEVSSQNIPSVVLRSNGEIIESKNEKGEVCFNTVAKKEGEVEYRITGLARGQSSSVSRDITVHESKAEASSFPEQLASVESGRGIVKATIYNNREQRKTYDVGISGLPETWTSTTEKTVILQPGEEREVFFYLTPREEGTFSPEIEISNDGETVFEESVELEVGGTTEKQEISILQRLRNALL